MHSVKQDQVQEEVAWSLEQVQRGDCGPRQVRGDHLETEMCEDRGGRDRV